MNSIRYLSLAALACCELICIQQSLNVRYPEDSETCVHANSWGVATGGEQFPVYMTPDATHLLYSAGLRPEVYFKPQEVWEIRGAESVPVKLSTTSIIPNPKAL